jgi:hypothetical protein
MYESLALMRITTILAVIAIVAIVLTTGSSIIQAFASQFPGCTGNPRTERGGEPPTGNPHDPPGDRGNPHDASLDGVEGFDSQCHGTHGGH